MKTSPTFAGGLALPALSTFTPWNCSPYSTGRNPQRSTAFGPEALTPCARPSRKTVLFAAVISLILVLQGGKTLAAPFELFVTQSPPGPQNTDPANWGGVLQYHLTTSGGILNPGAGIDKSNLDDPGGLAYRASTSELFVGNRWGNINPSSISRFIYDPVTRRLTPNGVITGNNLYGVHQIAFNPVTGEMFAANYSYGVSRFTFDANGNALANGIIGSGSMRGVAVSPDGRRLYASSVSSVIRQFDLATGAELAGVVVPSGVGGLHYLQIFAGRLYAAAPSDNCVYRYTIGADDNLTFVDSINNTPAGVGIALSPDGQELFVSGHAVSDLIYRFEYNSQNDSWTASGTFDTGSSLLGLLAIPSGPEPAIALTPTNSVIVSWPLPADGWVLQQTSSLTGNPPPWLEISPPYQTNLTQAWIITTPALGNQFFRLYHP